MSNVKIFTDNVEGSAINQIYTAAKSPAFEGVPIRIMPDTHAGKGSVIGFTAPVTDKIIPNIVGVDIGCGMLTVELGNINLDKLDLQTIDNFIRNNIPHGFNNRKKLHKYFVAYYDMEVRCKSELPKLIEQYALAMGSLGGGNHFIEIAQDSKGTKYLIIHSGSRKFGLDVAVHYQKKAIQYHMSRGHGINKDLAYLEGQDAQDYLYDMRIAQEFASMNRYAIAHDILSFIFDKPSMVSYLICDKSFETIHNYISPKDNIVRKGAISAYEDETVLIPINMRDGSILGRGKGNADWNYSGPHGAGRILSRGAAKRELSLEEYQETMEGIYSTSVKKSTLDEAPMAYKSMEEILENIGDNIEVLDILKPIYNFKA